eukprot:8675969-Pyramimonas_sp.AAC.1
MVGHCNTPAFQLDMNVVAGQAIAYLSSCLSERAVGFNYWLNLYRAAQQAPADLLYVICQCARCFFVTAIRSTSPVLLSLLSAG